MDRVGRRRPRCPTGGTTFSQGEDAYGIDANVQIIPGLRIGGSWLSNTIGQFAGQGGTPGGSSQWHVYGNPAVPSLNPVTSVNPALPGCVAVATGNLPGQNPIQGGIACPALGWGWSGYVMWDVIPGIQFDGEYANRNDGVHSSSDSGYYANVTVDLGTMLGVGHNFTLQGGYEYLGVNFYPPYGQDADALMAGTQFPGNFQGFLGTLSFEILPNVTILGKYITGNSVSNSQGIEEWQAGVVWTFAPGTFLWVRLEEERLASISQYYTYRAEMNYRF